MTDDEVLAALKGQHPDSGACTGCGTILRRQDRDLHFASGACARLFRQSPTWRPLGTKSADDALKAAERNRLAGGGWCACGQPRGHLVGNVDCDQPPDLAAIAGPARFARPEPLDITDDRPKTRAEAWAREAAAMLEEARHLSDQSLQDPGLDPGDAIPTMIAWAQAAATLSLAFAQVDPPAPDVRSVDDLAPTCAHPNPQVEPRIEARRLQHRTVCPDCGTVLVAWHAAGS